MDKVVFIGLIFKDQKRKMIWLPNEALMTKIIIDNKTMKPIKGCFEVILNI